MRISLVFRTALLPLVAASALATTAHAMQPSPNAERADLLFSRAVAQEAQSTTTFSRHVRRTAHLYLQSAELRDASDPLKIESLQRAGGLLMKVDAKRAQRAIEEAAELALSRGDVMRTAHLYLDGAWLVGSSASATTRTREAANQYLNRARLLAGAPGLSEAERNSILKRIAAPAPAMAASR
jgi:hypothetical protein